MTDNFNAPPLTRRERRERERAAAAAAAVSATGAAEPEALLEPDAEATAADLVTEPSTDGAEELPGVAEQRWNDHAEGMAPTEALDMTEVRAPAGLGSVREVVDAEGGAAVDDEAVADSNEESDLDVLAASVESDEQDEEAVAAPSGFGRFFGRRKNEDTDEEHGSDRAADSDSSAEAADEETAVDTEDAAGTVDVAAPQRLDTAERPVIAVPASASPLPLDERPVEELDEEAIASIEVDEVPVNDQDRISSRWVAAATPAQLEDTRPESDESEAAGESEESAFAAARRTGRAPVVVNVVEDTSEHHIADLRTDTESIATASSVGTGTSTITANALVLPASGAHEPITIEGEDGVIVTGSIDLPDGFASSGRNRGTFDTADVDATIDDPGELRTPETQPVRASKAVSSYANARVQIAPTRRSSSNLVMALGIGGGAVAVGVGAVAVLGIVLGWF